MTESATYNQRGRCIISLMLIGTLIVLLRTKGSVILLEWTPALVWAIPGLILCAWRSWKTETDSDTESSDRVGLILLGGMLLYLISSAALSHRFFLQPSIPNSDASPLSLNYVPARLALTFSVASLLLFWKRVTPGILFAVLLLFAVLTQAHHFLTFMDGQALYRDDHPAFMHRFWGIREAFPAWAFYDPSWNGGRIQTAAMASGSVNLGFLLQPLLRMGEIHEVYNTVFIVCFMLFIPAVVFLSARLCGCGWTGCWVAAILSLTLSRYNWIWLLNYGTVSACSTSPMLLLIAACLYRVLFLDRRERWLIPLFAFALFFYLAWPPSAIMGVPLAVATGLSLIGKSRKTILFVFIMSCAGIIAASPHYLAIMANIDLGRMAGIKSEQPELLPSVEKGFRILLSHGRQANPLLIFLGLAGTFVLTRPGHIRFFGLTLLLLMIPAGWGEIYKPQYQLVRSGIPLMFLAILPAALWVQNLTTAPRWGRWAAALIFSFLLMGVFRSHDVLAGKTDIRFYPMPESIRDFADYIQENTHPSDRILFAGSTVHGVGGGHVAYLPVLTDREMLSCDYYAFSPKLVEYEYPPKAWRKEDGGNEAFMALHNVSHVVTYHKHWIRYFDERPDLYESVFSFGEKPVKQVYKVSRDSASLFLEGAGSIESTINELHVTLEGPSTDPVVIKYNWVEDLEVEPPATIHPFPVKHDIEFIQIDPQGLQDIRIFHKGLW